MSHERSRQAPDRKPFEVFGFSKQEYRDGWVDRERFQAIITDDETKIHSVEESYNNYGDFLFVTASRLTPQRRICMTFFGLGYHEYRERWLTHHWFWYQTPRVDSPDGISVNPGSSAAMYVEFTDWDETPSPDNEDIVGTAKGKIAIGSHNASGDEAWLAGTFEATIVKSWP